MADVPDCSAGVRRRAAPRLVLRLLLLAYPKNDPRRDELMAELRAIPRIERPFWVAEQTELALAEGLPRRLRELVKRKKNRQRDEATARKQETAEAGDVARAGSLAPPGQTCPICGSPRIARFCEEDGYDFELGPVYAARASAAKPAGTAAASAEER
jgi:hypothetical protein